MDASDDDEDICSRVEEKETTMQKINNDEKTENASNEENVDESQLNRKVKRKQRKKL